MNRDEAEIIDREIYLHSSKAMRMNVKDIKTLETLRGRENH